MAVLKIVYTEEDKSVQLYRDCDIEAICRSWLDRYIAVQETSFVLQLTTAQELVLMTMQSLLCSEYKQLLPNVLFYVEDTQFTLDCNGNLDHYPVNYPSYQLACLERIWNL